MEQEIDLRPYAQAVLRRWRWIAMGVLAAVVLATIITLIQPRANRARVTVLLDLPTSQVVLDGRFSERDSSLVTNPADRRRALIDLATSPVLEARVLDQLPQSDLKAGDLLPRVRVSATGDLLTITVTGRDAADAEQLAGLWGKAYEDLIRELYSRGAFGVEQIDQELSDARARHAEARRAVDAFLRQGDLARTSQEVTRLRELLGTSRQAHQALHATYLGRVRELSLLLEDARILRTQIERGEGVPSDALAALVVRLRTAGGGQLPVGLTINNPETLAAGREATLSDLERLTAIIESERDRLVRETQRVAAAIAAGDASAVGLDGQTRARYEAELAAAEGRLAELISEQRVLSQTVDLALNTLAVLQAKRDEQVIAQATSSVSVRYLGDVSDEPPTSRAVLLARNGLIAAVLAGFVAVVLIITLEIARQVRQAPAPAPLSRGEPAPDRPSASD